MKKILGLCSGFLLIFCLCMPALAEQTLEGRVLSVDPELHAVTILDVSDREEKTIQVEELNGIKPDSYVKMWVSTTESGEWKANRIQQLNRRDSTGMKRRLKKALSGMNYHRRTHRGHMGRCRRR
ncbi:MAG: hypothetical protein GXO58_03350 [Thermodesulfobacteria bacterium]|nr:hypothetical protein [Thermodesulfobacteriota bacterium]